MRFLAFSMLAAAVAAFSYSASAQLDPTWSIDLPGNLHWQRVMASGSYLVSTEAGLSA